MSGTTSSRSAGIVISALAVLVFVGVPLFAWFATLWTDYLWFADLGQAGVFWTRIASKWAVGAAFGAATFAILFGTMRVARSLAPRIVAVGAPQNIPAQYALAFERFVAWLGPILDKAIFFAAAFFAVTNGAAMAEQWETFRLALSAQPFGVDDPQFGRDVAFYVFALPAHQAVLAWLTGVLVLGLVLTLVVHLAGGGIQPWRRLQGFAPHVKAHVSVLLAGIVLSRAYAYWIAISELVLSPRGQVIGASHTDVTAQLPAYRILIVVSVAVAALLLANIRYRGWRLPVLASGAWLVAAVVLAGVWPGVVQRFIVAPNESRLEAPYIERNIEMTRRAFDLTDVEGKQFPATYDLTAAAVREDAATISNVRLWDPDIVKQGYAQLQTIRPYYEFADVDVDRYEVNGVTRQLLVSAREMNSALLADTAQTWVNRHLVYTHGFGLIMSPASEFDSRGLPRFVVGDIPPTVASSVASGSPDLEQTQPRIYFGERTTDYVIVNTGTKEFDFPLGEKNAFYQYEDPEPGVEVGNIVRRLAWAASLGSSQVLFSTYLTPESRVLMRRDLTTRLDALAPWLVYEDDPYPVVSEGRIVWVIDAYTSSRMYPYSERTFGGANYLRNSVKVTIDAFTGETTFYAFDAEDPVLAAWREIFPELFTDASEIPDSVARHFRYPQGLFEAQADIYRTYHMTDPGVFYNKEDQWEIPGERQGRPMRPFFVLLQLPGTEREQFYLMQPYTPRNRDNMIGWMAVSADPETYGERTVYLFPKERVILGPEQVSARINQDPLISPQLTLWNQRGSNVIFGNMVVIPIKDSIVYIQPVFLQAEETAIPELARVVVAYADKVEMQRTLEDALVKVFAEGGDSAEGTATPEPGGGGAEAGAGDLADAVRLYEQALQAQRAGDWATYGARIEELGRVLERLAGAETTATP